MTQGKPIAQPIVRDTRTPESLELPKINELLYRFHGKKQGARISAGRLLYFQTDFPSWAGAGLFRTRKKLKAVTQTKPTQCYYWCHAAPRSIFYRAGAEQYKFSVKNKPKVSRTQPEQGKKSSEFTV